MELWGGHECTVNRVGDRFRDQTVLTGHQDRPEDLSLFAGLGVSALRYPVLWERVAPDRPDVRDWRWSDARLAEIARLGLRPIVGLLHHGSGPRYTSLVADDFVPLFVDYAAAVAARYPYVDDWTPINEPLTTARFSALYGHWYPHARDEALFWRALLNQVAAVRGAMAAIRRVNPAARLIQTEDLGECYATAPLASVAEHLNQRRWMTWDLLAGRVVPGHAMWEHLSRYGLADRLHAIADAPCSPQVVGINHYPTSDRFLDHRLDHYEGEPPASGYHDLVALRIVQPPPPGLPSLLDQAWRRYGIPLAVTECHLGCTREEQLRWLRQSWSTCAGLAARGVDVRAWTAWALLGNVGWDGLLKEEAGRYESGVFTLTGDRPVPTAAVELLRVFAAGEAVASRFPTIDRPGWWQRDARLEHRPFVRPGADPPVLDETEGAPILFLGGSDAVRAMLVDECARRGLPYLLRERPTSCSAADRDRSWAIVRLCDVGPPRSMDHDPSAPFEATWSTTSADLTELRRLLDRLIDEVATRPDRMRPDDGGAVKLGLRQPAIGHPRPVRRDAISPAAPLAGTRW